MLPITSNSAHPENPPIPRGLFFVENATTPAAQDVSDDEAAKERVKRLLAAWIKSKNKMDVPAFNCLACERLRCEYHN